MSRYRGSPADVELRYNRDVIRWGPGLDESAVSPPRPSVHVDGAKVAENLTPEQTRAVEAWMRCPTWSVEGSVATVLGVIATAGSRSSADPSG